MQHELSKRSLRLVQGIQQALDEDKFILDYQPIMDLKNPDKPVFMMTCRMRTDSGQLLGFSSLRTLTDAADLDLKLDRWLTLKGLKTTQVLRKSDPGASIFIPLSGATLTTGDFPQWLARQQDLHDFPGTGMVLGFRLSQLSQDIRAAHQCINELHKLNIRILLQRFSDNPAALKVLKLLRAEYIEIPSRLLQTETKIITSILDMCKKLGVSVVLSDINSADEINLDWSNGANMLMGDYIHPPMDDTKFHFPPTLS